MDATSEAYELNVSEVQFSGRCGCGWERVTTVKSDAVLFTLARFNRCRGPVWSLRRRNRKPRMSATRERDQYGRATYAYDEIPPQSERFALWRGKRNTPRRGTHAIGVGPVSRVPAP